MTLTLNLDADLERRLAREAEKQGISLDEYALRLLETHLPPADRRAELIALLQSWIEEGQAQQHDDADDEFLSALDENRLSNRRLFPPELKGVTW